MEYAAADDGSLAACTDCKEATGLHRATEQQVEKEKTTVIPAAATKLTGHSGLQPLASIMRSQRACPNCLRPLSARWVGSPLLPARLLACLAASRGATLTAVDLTVHRSV